MTTPLSPSRNDPCPCGSGRKFKKCCGAPAAAAPVSPAQPWHDLDDRLTKDLSAFGRRRFGDAWAHMLADYPVDEETMEQVPEHVNLLIQWACEEKKFEGQPAAGHYLDARGRNLPAGDRAWLEAQQLAWLSIWEVADLQQDAWIDLVDLLTGERRRVIEIGASRSLHKGLALLARVVDHAGMSMLCGSHPNPLPPDASRRVLDDFRDAAGATWATKQVDAALLRAGEMPTILIGLWQDEVEALARRPLPELRNTDGEELVLVKDTFALVGAGARQDMTRRLAAEPDIQPPAHPRDAFVIEARKHGAAEDAAATVIAHVTMTAREIRLETNSRERADRLRERLERIGEGRLRHKSRSESDARQLLAEARQTEAAGNQRSSMPRQGPAADAAVLSFKRSHYADWVDHPLPALDGLSPREATANPAMRARLSLLLKEMEELEGRGPAGQRFDFGEMKRQLGMVGP